MLWEYKRKFSKDEKFEKAVKEKFCVADLKLVSGENRLKLLITDIYMYCNFISASDQTTFIHHLSVFDYSF